MSRFSDWDRKHTLLLVFSILFIIVLYTLVQQYVFADLKEQAESYTQDVDVDTSDMDLSSMSKNIPTEDELDLVMNEFSKIAENNGLLMQPINEMYSDTDDISDYGMLRSATYSFNVVGESDHDSTQSIDMYFNDLDSSNRLFRIDDVVIDIDDNIHMDMTLTLYYQSDSDDDVLEDQDDDDLYDMDINMPEERLE